jgi:lauroyl/myristoyl acyltransferase
MPTPGKQRLVARVDLKRTAALTLGWVLAALLPHRADRHIVSAVQRFWARTRSGSLSDAAARMVRTLPERFDAPQAHALAWGWLRRRAELNWGRMRNLHRAGWRATVEIEGIAHVVHARGAGRGVVVWFSSTCDSFLLMQALAQHGVPITHLSLHTHGSPGRSVFGAKITSRIHRIAEDRFLRERVIIRSESAPGYYKRLREALAANHAVTIRGDLGRGPREPLVSFLGLRRSFPAGAPKLAYQTGAVLLTAHVRRVAPCHYRVTMQEPLPLDRQAPRKDFVAAATAQYAARLETELAANPLDWDGWWLIDRYIHPPASAQ